MIASSRTIYREQMMRDPRYGQVKPDTHKRTVEALLDFCLRLDAAPKKRPALALEACRTHGGEKFSEGSLRKIYYDKWVASGRDWWELRNKSLMPETASTLPEETIAFWHELCFEHGGKHRAAHRVLRRRWEAGEPIPGFPATERGHDLARGLSYDNLMQPKYRPSELADKVASIGIGAAGELLPGVLTTRAGLPFGSRWVFDDIWHDFKVNVPGQTGARRLLQFHCIELLSACQAARGMKPELLNDKSGKMERLKEKELLFLLAHVLGNLGYNGDGCVLMMEHGTTNVDGRVEGFISDATGGRVTIERGAISGSPLAPGLYAGRGRGNFKFKAALESLGNLIHNELSSRLELPAQTGSNSRVNAPEALHGLEKHHDALVLALHALPAELRDLVRLPATPLWLGIEFADRVQEEINRRTEHELEGWETCRFLVSEYRTHKSQPWSPMTQLLEMAPALRAAIEEAVNTERELSRARRLSPREVFDGYRSTLTRLPAHLMPQLVGMEHAVERAAAKDGQFHFDDMELGPDEHHYSGIIYREDGEPVRLPPNERFATFASTVDPERMHLCDARGAYVGWVQRTKLPTRADAHGFARACGAKVNANRAALAPVLAAAAPIARRMAENAEVNDAINEHAQGARMPLPRKPAARVNVAASNRAAQLAALARTETAD